MKHKLFKKAKFISFALSAIISSLILSNEIFAYGTTAVLVGVNASGHDHTSALSAVKQTYVVDCGMTGELHTGSFTLYDIDGLISFSDNSVFISRSHGSVEYNTSLGIQIGTSILINESSNAQYKSSELLSIMDLSNLKLAMFIGCKTASGGNGAAHLPAAVVNKGAATSVGFKDNINCDTANAWTIDFFRYMAKARSVNNVCSYLATLSSYSSGGLDSYYISGLKTTTLR
ncbi:MAG: hypothetical protein HDT46_05690 [Ruminococcaceae bacterium]|nr:hypothetical protein [Oscillospiraceae bacterium]